MIVTIEHVTTYHYDRPLHLAVQSLRLFPASCAGQRVLDWSAGVTGGAPGPCVTDGAGDRVQGWSLRGPTRKLEIRAAGRVETTDQAGVLRGHRETVSPRAYLRATPATAADAGLRDLAGTAGAEGETGAGAGDALALAHALSRAVGAAIAYRPGVTHAHTTAAEALAQGEGVCQDHAHALICAARLCDLPARYVSGYLQADAAGAAHGAAHAWAEIYLEGLGWVGFDPANGCCPDARYIRLGSGLDAVQAAPIRGRVLGAEGERLQVSVAVMAQQQ